MKNDVHMEAPPVVSIVISAYNASMYIAATVNSFIRQTYRNWEMIIVNDGSTDNTSGIIHSFASEDDRIICIEQENKGMTKARQVGISMARGKYLLVFDSDDIIYPQALEMLVRIMEDNTADVVAIQFCFWYPDGKRSCSHKPDYKEINGIEYLKRALTGTAYWALWLHFVRREIFLKVDFDIGAGLLLGEDMVIIAQIMDEKTKVVASDVPLIDYRWRDDSISRIRTDKFYQDFRDSMDITEGILEKNRTLYGKLRKSIAASQLDRRLSGIFMGDKRRIARDLHDARNYLLRYPSLWNFIRKKDKSMSRLMTKYLFLQKSAIKKAADIAETNRVII